MIELKNKIASSIAKKLRGVKTRKEIFELIEKPPQIELGDYSFPCFSLSKKLKKKPNLIAEELSKELKIRGVELIKPVNGYLNFFIDSKNLAENVIGKVLKEKEKYGLNNDLKKRKIMVEFLSPNTNKPLHLGHLRNMSLGESVSRIFEANGARVFRTQVINDRGTHICKSIVAYLKWGKGKTPEKTKKKPDHFVGDYYVLFAKKARENSMLDIEAQQMLLKWEKQEPTTMKLWKKMNSWALKGHKETVKRFGVKFDKEYFESNYYLKGKKLIQDGLKKKIFTEHNGATLVELEKYGLPNKVLIRADGSSLYITQDIYLAKMKFDEFKMNESIYVVGSEQKLYFQQLFKTLELMKFPWSKNLYHLSYGMVYLPEGKMKSREGKIVDADDLMNEVQTLALKQIKKRDKKISKKEALKKAEIIALSAIKFYLLKVDAVKDIHFNPEESLSFEGETGPYVQYSYARIKSILKKTRKTSNIDYSKLSLLKEKQLITILNNYPNIVREAVKQKSPHKIAHYLLELSNTFNSYYHETRILNASEGEKNARIVLITAISLTLKNGLNLLGVKTLEKM